MGMIFRLIADEALQSEDSSYYTGCQVCGKPQVPVYQCQGFLARTDGTADRARDVYVACESCLKEGRVVHIGERHTDQVIERFAADVGAEKRLLRATPRIPLHMQGDDWPLCCRTLTEFQGAPSSLEELIRVQASGAPWDHGPTDPAYYDTRRDGPPESFDEVAVFRCLVCGRHYWTFQPT